MVLGEALATLPIAFRPSSGSSISIRQIFGRKRVAAPIAAAASLASPTTANPCVSSASRTAWRCALSSSAMRTDGCSAIPPVGLPLIIFPASGGSVHANVTLGGPMVHFRPCRTKRCSCVGGPSAPTIPAMRAMVTGGAGFIGSHLVDALLARGDEVHVLDDLSTGRRENIADGAALHEGDIRWDCDARADEEAPRRPLAPYGTAKLAAEEYIQTYNRLYGSAHTILRYGNVYGPRQDPHGEAGVVAIFIGRLRAG